MLDRIAPRSIYAGIAICCFGLIGFALYLQHAEGLEPCPLCVLQRIAFIFTGLIALIGIMHGAAAGSRWLPIALALPVTVGLITAGRHVWLEHFPPEALGCGASDLGYLIQTTPLAKILPAIFRGTGDCAIVLWRFLGLSIAEWSLIWFATLIGATALLLFSAIVRHQEKRARIAGTR